MALYVIYDEQAGGDGFVQGFTTLQGLADYTGIPYFTLIDHFSRKKRVWHYYTDKRIKVIKVARIHKGKSGIAGYKARVEKGHNRNI